MNPPRWSNPAVKHSAKSRLNAGRDVRHFCDLGTRSWRGDERGGLSLLSPCTLQEVLRLRAELQLQSVRGGCGSRSLLTPHPRCGLPVATVTALQDWGFSSIPALLGRCPFPPGTFLPCATAKPGAGLAPHSPGTTASLGQAARLGGIPALQLLVEQPSLTSCPTWGCKQTNKHPSIKPQQLTPS